MNFSEGIHGLPQVPCGAPKTSHNRPVQFQTAASATYQEPMFGSRSSKHSMGSPVPGRGVPVTGSRIVEKTSPLLTACCPLPPSPGAVRCGALPETLPAPLRGCVTGTTGFVAKPPFFAAASADLECIPIGPPLMSSVTFGLSYCARPDATSPQHRFAVAAGLACAGIEAPAREKSRPVTVSFPLKFITNSFHSCGQSFISEAYERLEDRHDKGLNRNRKWFACSDLRALRNVSLLLTIKLFHCESQ